MPVIFCTVCLLKMLIRESLLERLVNTLGSKIEQPMHKKLASSISLRLLPMRECTEHRTLWCR